MTDFHGQQPRRALTNVPSLCKNDPQEKDNKEGYCSSPSVRDVWSYAVEIGLILLAADIVVVSNSPKHEASHKRHCNWMKSASSWGLKRLTLVSRDVWAVNAMKGVWSGSGASMAPRGWERNRL